MEQENFPTEKRGRRRRSPAFIIIDMTLKQIFPCECVLFYYFFLLSLHLAATQKC